MENFIALFFALLGCILTVVVVGKRKKWISVALLGLFARFTMSLIHRYVYTLPQGASDAKVFQRVAIEYASAGCGSFFDHFDPSKSYVYSSVLAELFSCIGYSPLGAQIINATLGNMAIILIAIRVATIWGNSIGYTTLLLLSIFPPLLVFSAVTLRESLIFFAFSMGMFVATASNKRLSMTRTVHASGWFAIATLFHPGMISGVLGILIARVFQTNYDSSSTGETKSVSITKNVFYAAIFILPAFPLLMSLELNKIGTLGELEVNNISSVLESRADGGAAYLTGLPLNSLFDLLWQAPLRVFYLLFAPMPWDIRSAAHIFAIFDAWLYLILFFLAYRLRSFFPRDNRIILVLSVMVILCVTFGLGTSNFATGMRHRSKFAPWLFLIFAPLLQKKYRIHLTS